jgi:hypothetical protein
VPLPVQSRTILESVTMNHAKTAEYLEVQAYAQQQLKAGHIKAYCTGHSHERGRYIEVQTDQGWNPEPWWQEFYPEPWSGSNDSL